MNWKNIEVLWNDRLVMTMPNKDELSRGKEALLEDGSCVAVQLKNYAGIVSALLVSRNGMPVPGSDGDAAHADTPPFRVNCQFRLKIAPFPKQAKGIPAAEHLTMKSDIC